MIVGGGRWADPGTSYDQTNDVVEELLRKLGYAHPLQSCGHDAAGSAMEAAGHDLTTTTRADYRIPADDLMGEWFNNPRNYPAMRALSLDPTTEPNGRHAKLYPLCVRSLWGVMAEWVGGFTGALMPQHLRHGRTWQVCLLHPGHYIAVVAYDEATGEFIGNDSWAKRPRVPALPPRGFNFRLTAMETADLAGEAVLYFPPSGM